VRDINLDAQKKDVRVFASSALWVLKDEKIVTRLLDEVRKDPAALPRHEQILNLVLRGRRAPEPLLKLLDSPQPKIRAAAAHVLVHCVDDALIPHIPRLAKSADSKLRAYAATMGCAQRTGTFGFVRESLLPLLKDEQIDVRCAAAIGLGERRDIAAAQVLLELWSDSTVPAVHQIAINSAIQA
jgi:HEAT repeat protein